MSAQEAAFSLFPSHVRFPPQQRLTVLHLLSSFLFFFMVLPPVYIFLKNILEITSCVLLPDLLLRSIHGDVLSCIPFICTLFIHSVVEGHFSFFQSIVHVLLQAFLYMSRGM